MTDLLGPASAANSVTVEPADARTFGGSDTWFKDCSSPTASDGTAVGASLLNAWLAQLRNAIRGTGITVDNTDNSMLLKAILSTVAPYAVDTGSVGAMVVDVNTPGFSLSDGHTIKVKFANGIIGPTTIDVKNGGVDLGTFNLVRVGGGPLSTNDVFANAIEVLTFVGAVFHIPQRFQNTGDILVTAATVTGGYVPLNGGTIGNAASSASVRANADTALLFAYLYANFTNTLCPVSGGRGANAAADYAANKTITMPDAQARGLICIDNLGPGGTATGRLAGGLIAAGNATTPGSSGGEAAHTLTNAETALHTHAITDPGHNHTVTGPVAGSSAASGGAIVNPSGTSTTSTSTTGVTIQSAGGATPPGGGAHNNLQPFLSVVMQIRL